MRDRERERNGDRETEVNSLIEMTDRLTGLSFNTYVCMYASLCKINQYWLKQTKIQTPETELTESVLKKRSKTHKRLKERFLIGGRKSA